MGSYRVLPYTGVYTHSSYMYTSKVFTCSVLSRGTFEGINLCIYFMYVKVCMYVHIMYVCNRVTGHLGLYQPLTHPPSNQPLTVQCEQQLETNHPRNLNYNKLRVAWHGPGNTRARRTNTANRAPNMLMHHGHVTVHVCAISILWNFLIRLSFASLLGDER